MLLLASKYIQCDPKIPNSKIHIQEDDILPSTLRKPDDWTSIVGHPEFICQRQQLCTHLGGGCIRPVGHRRRRPPCICWRGSTRQVQLLRISGKTWKKKDFKCEYFITFLASITCKIRIILLKNLGHFFVVYISD